LKPVGIIANPASGKDIRRLVAYGSVFDNNEKVNVVRRVILGLDSMGVKEIVSVRHLRMPCYPTKKKSWRQPRKFWVNRTIRQENVPQFPYRRWLINIALGII